MRSILSPQWIAQSDRTHCHDVHHPDSGAALLRDRKGNKVKVTPEGKTVSKLSELDLKELAIAESYSAPDRYVGYNHSDWYPWANGLELKSMRFDNRSGNFVVILANRTDKEAELGKHRHRGAVNAVTLKGEWWYEEYDWRAGPGDYVTESPGTIHTLHLGAHTEVLFTVSASLEFYNNDDTLRQTMDIFSFQKLYLDDCAAKGKKPDDSLWY